ncbi:hypothetical protein [Symbioplanes lichenis]|uniref:hypothetical protein n=1 Tax=Symbioplanes lichenis TaxID=1629072 RepID=UPI0027398A33|nr:hypothetical protein [Actinoplanes lichenis]
MTADFDAAARFLVAEARLLERRLFATLFQGESPDGVLSALRAHQNEDGGFGHGLEPDTRCPASLPIYTEIAFQTLAAAGVSDSGLLGPACDHLARIASPGGAVPLAFPVIEDYPRAGHWSEWTYQPGVNPTAGLAGLLHQLGFDHPWRTAATDWCWQAEVPDEVHALSEMFVFLAYGPDRARAEKTVPALLERLLANPMFQSKPNPGEYGLTPLHIAPTADSPWRDLFPAGDIEAHLDQLAAAQEKDGGWPITWEPPGPAARLEWRGMVTLQALRTLRSYGRI